MLFTWLALSLLATVTNAANPRCKTKDLRTLNKQVIHVKPFCRYYLSRHRTRSPLVEFSAAKLTELCQCRFPRMRKVSTRDIASGRSAKLPYSACNKSYMKKVQAQYREPVQFCKYYTAFDRMQEPLLPVPGLKSAKAVQRACACHRGKSVSKASTKSKSSTTRAVTTTSTKTSAIGLATTTTIATTIGSETLTSVAQSTTENVGETTTTPVGNQMSTTVTTSVSDSVDPISTEASTVTSTEASTEAGLDATAASSSDTSQATSTPTPTPLSDFTASSVKYQDGITYRNFYRRNDESNNMAALDPDYSDNMHGINESVAIQYCANVAVLHGFNTFTLKWAGGPDVPGSVGGLCNAWLKTYTDPNMLNDAAAEGATVSGFYALESIGPEDATGASPAAFPLINPTQNYAITFSGLGWGVQGLDQSNIRSGVYFPGSSAIGVAETCLDMALRSQSPGVKLSYTGSNKWYCQTYNQEIDLRYVQGDETYGDVYIFALSTGVVDPTPFDGTSPSSSAQHTLITQGVALARRGSVDYYTAATIPAGASSLPVWCHDYVISSFGQGSTYFEIRFDRLQGAWICRTSTEQYASPPYSVDFVSLASSDYTIGDSYMYAIDQPI